MRVSKLMHRDVKTCSPDDSLDQVARLLWDHDVGVIPVVSGARTVGMITDRDVCMAAYTQGRPLRELTVAAAMSKELFSVQPQDSVEDALGLMRDRQVRRLPVVDDAGALQGVLTINDIVGAASQGLLDAAEVVQALADIGRQRSTALVRRPEASMVSAR